MRVARNGYQPVARLVVPSNCPQCAAPGEPEADRCPYCRVPYRLLLDEELKPPKSASVRKVGNTLTGYQPTSGEMLSM